MRLTNTLARPLANAPRTIELKGLSFFCEDLSKLRKVVEEHVGDAWVILHPRDLVADCAAAMRRCDGRRTIPRRVALDAVQGSSMTDCSGLTRALARYAVASRYDALPEAVQREAERAFLNWIGVAIGGCHELAVMRAAQYVSAKGGSPQASLIGYGVQSDVESAAFVNCISSSVLAYDDAHLPTVAHPSGPAAAALFAVAQTRAVHGHAFLNALVLGIEVQCRIANMLVQPPSPIDPNFYVNGFSGPVGVAVAVGRILGLDEERMSWAIGIAASQASGFRATHGTMTAHFRPGHAARCGVLGALLAEQGFDCIDDALEARGGFIEVYAAGSEPRRALDALGTRHEMLRNRYKPYPCGIVIHPVIDACQEIRAKLPASAKLTRIRLSVNPLVLALTGKRRPRTQLESHVSVYHWAAVSLLKDAPGLAATEVGCLEDPAILALRDHIEALGCPEIGKGEARAEVALADGTVLNAHVVHARGSQARPMTNQELEAKFLSLATRILSREASERLLAACWRASEMDDVGESIGAMLP
jgi:2-methylcitrate dehydratase PrpD